MKLLKCPSDEPGKNPSLAFPIGTMSHVHRAADAFGENKAETPQLNSIIESYIHQPQDGEVIQI